MENDKYIRTENGLKVEVSDVYTTLMRKVYGWMALALAVTAATAFVVTGNGAILTALYSAAWVIPVLCVVEVVMVIWLSARLHSMSFKAAGWLFGLYAVLNGVTLSSLLIVYDIASVGTAFAVTAGVFLVMAAIGSWTKKDLTRWGGILLMAVIGLLIALVVNIFVGNSVLDLVISCVGVLIFTGLTAYDAQKIKKVMMGVDEVDESSAKLAIFFALDLYLDFINIFIYLLRLFGRRN